MSERVELWESVQPSPSTIMHIKVATVNAYGKMIQTKRPALPMVECAGDGVSMAVSMAVSIAEKANEESGAIYG